MNVNLKLGHVLSMSGLLAHFLDVTSEDTALGEYNVTNIDDLIWIKRTTYQFSYFD